MTLCGISSGDSLGLRGVLLLRRVQEVCGRLDARPLREGGGLHGPEPARAAGPVPRVLLATRPVLDQGLGRLFHLHSFAPPGRRALAAPESVESQVTGEHPACMKKASAKD